MLHKRFGTYVGLGLAAVTMVAPARAGIFQYALVGIESAGFFVSGERNPLTGGTFIQLDRAFNNETLDFGAHELTLSGQLRSRFETNTRFPATLDFQLNTRGAPLNYTYVVDTGSQLTTFTGNALLDVDGSINAFGFYDLRVNIADRQTVTADGRFQNLDGEQNDLNIGPINVRGNIFADLLASLFDPFFEASGTQNIFASFSGRNQLDQQLAAQAARLRSRVADGQGLDASTLDTLAGSAVLADLFGADALDLSFLSSPDLVSPSDSITPSAGLVPEPTTLLLLAPALIVGVRKLQRRV